MTRAMVRIRGARVLLQRSLVLLITICCSVSLLLLLSGCGDKKQVPSVSAAKQEARIVEFTTPRDGSIQPSVDYTGTLVPVNAVGIFSKIPGRVERVLVKEGDMMQAGQLLVQLEDRESLAQVREITANLSVSRTQLAKAQAGYDLQDTQVAVGIGQSIQGKLQAEFSSEQARLNLEDAKINRDRMQRLYDRGAIPKNQLESAELRYNITKKQYETTLSMIKQSEESIRLAKANTAMKSIKKEDIATARAQIESLEAALDLAKANLDNCRIVAPFAGVITLKKVDKGEIVSAMPTGEPLLMIVDNNSVNFEGEVGEGAWELIKTGQTVELFMDAIPDKVFKGFVQTIIPAADAKSRSFRVKVSVPNKSGELASGMFGRASILLKPVVGLVIPRRCLLMGQEEGSVSIVENKNKPDNGPHVEKTKKFSVFVDNGGKAKKIQVKIGAMDEKEAVILDGLTKESRVVSVGQETLQENEPIVQEPEQRNKVGSE